MNEQEDEAQLNQLSKKCKSLNVQISNFVGYIEMEHKKFLGYKPEPNEPNPSEADVLFTVQSELSQSVNLPSLYP